MFEFLFLKVLAYLVKNEGALALLDFLETETSRIEFPNLSFFGTEGALRVTLLVLLEETFIFLLRKSFL